MAQKKKFLLRIDESLYIALEKWATNELRSINAQIEFLLKEFLRRAGRLPETTKKFIDETDNENNGTKEFRNTRKSN